MLLFIIIVVILIVLDILIVVVQVNTKQLCIEHFLKEYRFD